MNTNVLLGIYHFSDSFDDYSMLKDITGEAEPVISVIGDRSIDLSKTEEMAESIMVWLVFCYGEKAFSSCMNILRNSGKFDKRDFLALSTKIKGEKRKLIEIFRDTNRLDSLIELARIYSRGKEARTAEKSVG